MMREHQRLNNAKLPFLNLPPSLPIYCSHSQVDNPLNVLSQDAARSFLSSSKADEKYKFFLNGTQLTQLATEYEVVQNVIYKIGNAIDQQAEALPELAEKKKEQVEKYRLAEKAREQMQKLEQINKLMVWSQVVGKERVSNFSLSI